MNAAQKYFDEIRPLIDAIATDEMDKIQKVAELMTDATVRGRLIYYFGAGHSQLLAMEMFTRAGGLGNAQAMIDPGLVFIGGAARQGGFERLPGYGKIVVQDYDIQKDDVVFVISNSGRNPAVVEVAMAAREKGAVVVAIVSMKHATSVTPNNPYGKMLHEVADIVIDNHGPAGDALVKLEGLEPPVAGSSTVLGACILQSLVAQTAQNLIDRGQMPPVGYSGNMPQAAEYRKKVGDLRARFRAMMRNA